MVMGFVGTFELYDLFEKGFVSTNLNKNSALHWPANSNHSTAMSQAEYSTVDSGNSKLGFVTNFVY